MFIYFLNDCLEWFTHSLLDIPKGYLIDDL
jgi:hypothetical protein